MKTGVQRIEIVEKGAAATAENDEFECALIYCIRGSVKQIIMDDGEKENHPLWQYTNHPIIGPRMLIGKISARCIGMWQKQMFDAFVEGVWEIPKEWDVICRRLAHFAWVVLEGSDTFLYPASGAPYVERK